MAWFYLILQGASDTFVGGFCCSLSFVCALTVRSTSRDPRRLAETGTIPCNPYVKENAIRRLSPKALTVRIKHEGLSVDLGEVLLTSTRRKPNVTDILA